MMRTSFIALAALIAAPAFAQSDMQPAAGETAEMATATATMMGADGAEHGTVTLEQTPNGVLLTAELTGVPAGVHGFHVHETGACEPPFQSAGGHFNPTDANHGFLDEGGPHAGDMPNIHVPEPGDLMIEVLNPMISLNEGDEGYLMDEDGSAILIHAGGDDYRTDPAGDSGDRIACGVIE